MDGTDGAYWENGVNDIQVLIRCSSGGQGFVSVMATHVQFVAKKDNQINFYNPFHETIRELMLAGF